MPDDRLAAAAGLATDNGIVIDEYCRSSDPAIFAAGDVLRFPGPHGLVRQEDWRHAQDQGTVAGRNAAGANDAYRSTPSFWSEQFGLYIQGVGWASPRPDQRVRRQGANVMTFELKDGHIGYALGINAQREMAVVRRLIERRVAVDSTALAEPTKALADLLKTKP
jgi:3-phenylpropionate/trans-cinnamate dioxygenase ferredoxin reductase subunit